jgi:hypothetical protein
MKKLLLATILVGTLCLHNKTQAQSYTYVIDSLLLHLDKSAISTGILYDRAWPLANLQTVNNSSPDTLSNVYFKQAYFEMFTSAYNQSAWVPTDTIKNRITAARIAKYYPIGISFYRFNVIDTAALTNHLIQMHSDSLYYDVPGRATSPYNTMRAFIASPLVDSVDATSYVQFNFPTNLFINKSSLTMSSLKVDFNDGNGLVSVSLGQSYSITYTSNGIKYLKFVIIMSDNSTYTTYGQVKVYNAYFGPPGGIMAATTTSTSTPTCNIVSQDIPITSAGTFQGYDESSATSGVGMMRIYYATTGSCDGVLRKPIIALDGFDPTDQNSIDDIYRELNVLYPNIGAGFADYLRSQGYDIVILNFPEYYINGKLRDGGADYIERNAQVFISALDQINTMKSGIEKNIVFGPSMGGLISRYGLAYMEQHQHAHKVKLWISLDSPHEGANIPLADQWFLNYLKGDSDPAKDALNNQINSAAAKEMLVNHYLANAYGPAGMPGFRDRFSSALNTIGFPVGDAGQTFRKISVVDGSLGGTLLHQGCQTAMDFNTHGAPLQINIFFIHIKINGPVVLRTISNFTPDYASCQIFSGSRLIFHRPQVVNYTTPSTTTGYDGSPGGTATTQKTIYDQSNYMITRLQKYNIGINLQSEFTTLVPDHSFIPTKSALAFQGSNTNLSENVSTRNLVCTHETPFDSYFGSFTVNAAHTNLSNSAMNWLYQEIIGNPQQPSVVSQNVNYTITGPNAICNTATYSVAGLPSGATVSWSISPSGLATLTPSGQSVIVSMVSSGDIILSATVLNNCLPSNPASLAIHLGGPNIPPVTAFLKNMGGYYNIIFGTTWNTSYSYAWTINGYSSGGNSSSCTVRASDCNSGGPILSIYDVTVTVTNSCGSTNGCAEWKFTCPASIVNTSNCSGGGGTPPVGSAATTSTSAVIFYPNPSTQSVILSSRQAITSSGETVNTNVPFS